MNYIFFGTPEFAVIILEKLINAGFIPVAVICNPDKPVGRKKIITPPAVKQLLIEKFKDYKIKILQPKILANYKLQITNYKPDFFIVAAYSKILPKEILKISRFGTIGVHPSLLPKYRGASPIQTTILNGEKETGVTLYLMDKEIDSGPILATSHLPLSNSDNYELMIKKLAESGADLLVEFLRKIEPISNQQLAISNLAIPQDESQATYTKKFKTEDAFIESQDLEKARGSIGSPQETRQLAVEIDRKIRALNPEPGTWTILNGKRTKLLEAKVIDEKLKITKIQVEGKKSQNTCRVV